MCFRVRASAPGVERVPVKPDDKQILSESIPFPRAGKIKYSFHLYPINIPAPPPWTSDELMRERKLRLDEDCKPVKTSYQVSTVELGMCWRGADPHPAQRACPGPKKGPPKGPLNIHWAQVLGTLTFLVSQQSSFAAGQQLSLGERHLTSFYFPTSVSAS